MSDTGFRCWPVLLLMLAGCPGGSPAPGEPFVEVAAQSGLDFVHFNGMSGELYFVEMMGSGVALLDYDNDGDLDAYLVQGSLLGDGKSMEDATFPPRHPLPLTDRLYRNDSVAGPDGRVSIAFTDVTEDAGLRPHAYGMGVATADIDNDGWVDLYLTNFGPNQLLRNTGDGRFIEISAHAGADDPRWSVSASFVDYDRDGWLDLYVGNYVNYTLAGHKPCRSTTSARDYCSPLVYRPEGDRLLRNLGGGRFEDVSRPAGVAEPLGGALGVVAADFNGDGWPDIYVANDGVPNLLWVNQRDGRFTEEAALAGAAVDMNGKPEASMGVDAADFDGDGDEDLFMTHLARESNTLYVNDGRGWFEDRTVTMGLSGASLPYTGFGTAWFDYDNDGWLDLLAVNGAVTRLQSLVDRGDPYPLHQRNQLYASIGDGSYRELGSSAGAAFALSEVSRGAAFGDIDNDGDIDVLVSNNSGPARLLLNQAGEASAWLGLRLVGAEGRDAIGARVALLRDGASPLWRRAHTDGSYASASDPRIVFGLGTRSGAHDVQVVWPDGRRERFRRLALRRYHTLVRGDGTADADD